jgi:hypothetical protein
MCIPRKIGNVGREVGRQAKRPDFVREPEPPEVLHGPRLRCIRLRIECRRWFLINQYGGDATPAEFVGEDEATRPSANNQHRALAWKTQSDDISTPVPGRFEGRGLPTARDHGS